MTPFSLLMPGCCGHVLDQGRSVLSWYREGSPQGWRGCWDGPQSPRNSAPSAPGGDPGPQLRAAEEGKGEAQGRHRKATSPKTMEQRGLGAGPGCPELGNQHGFPYVSPRALEMVYSEE